MTRIQIVPSPKDGLLGKVSVTDGRTDGAGKCRMGHPVYAQLSLSVQRSDSEDEQQCPQIQFHSAEYHGA